MRYCREHLGRRRRRSRHPRGTRRGMQDRRVRGGFTPDEKLRLAEPDVFGVLNCRAHSAGAADARLNEARAVDLGMARRLQPLPSDAMRTLDLTPRSLGAAALLALTLDALACTKYPERSGAEALKDVPLEGSRIVVPRPDAIATAQPSQGAASVLAERAATRSGPCSRRPPRRACRFRTATCSSSLGTTPSSPRWRAERYLFPTAPSSSPKIG